MSLLETTVRSKIIVHADTPYTGATYYDLAAVLADATLFGAVIDDIASQIPQTARLVIAPEASGFMWGASVAARSGRAFLPLRKSGCIFGRKISITGCHPFRRNREFTYELSETPLLNHRRVAIVDDIIFSGRTVASLVETLRSQQITVEVVACVLGFPAVFAASMSTPVYCVVSLESCNQDLTGPDSTR